MEIYSCLARATKQLACGIRQGDAFCTSGPPRTVSSNRCRYRDSTAAFIWGASADGVCGPSAGVLLLNLFGTVGPQLARSRSIPRDNISPRAVVVMMAISGSGIA